MDSGLTAQNWFALGERVPYDHRAKRILREKDSADSSDIVHVFRRVVGTTNPRTGSNRELFENIIRVELSTST